MGERQRHTRTLWGRPGGLAASVPAAGVGVITSRQFLLCSDIEVHISGTESEFTSSYRRARLARAKSTRDVQSAVL
jgi:hypothetical protein